MAGFCYGWFLIDETDIIKLFHSKLPKGEKIMDPQTQPAPAAPSPGVVTQPDPVAAPPATAPEAPATDAPVPVAPEAPAAPEMPAAPVEPTPDQAVEGAPAPEAPATDTPAAPPADGAVA